LIKDKVFLVGSLIGYGFISGKLLKVSEIYYDREIKFTAQGNIDLSFDTILKTKQG